jgi:hypothetical protein
MPFYYHCAAMNIDSLTRQISLEPATNTSPITAGGSTNAVTEKHATQSLVEHPAFSWVLWSMISWLMAIVLLAVTLLWIVFNRDGYLINRSAK